MPSVEMDNSEISQRGDASSALKSGNSLFLGQKEYVLAIMGLALFYAWDLTGVYGAPLTSASRAGSFELAVAISGLCTTLGCVVTALILYRLRGFDRLVTVAAVMAGVLSVLPYGLDIVGISSPSLALVMQGLCRFCAATVIVAWGAHYSRFGTLKITACALAAFLVSFVLYLLIGFAGGALRASLIGVTLPLSMVCMMVPSGLRNQPSPAEDDAKSTDDVHADANRTDADGEKSAHKNGARKPSAAKAFADLTWRVILIFFLFGIVTWITILNAQKNATQPSVGNFVMCGCAIVVAILLLLVLLLGRTFSTSYIFKLVLPLMMAGVLLAVVFSFDSPVGTSLVSIGYTCLDVFCFILFADAIRKTGVDPVRAFSWCRAFEASVPPVTLGILFVLNSLFGVGENLLVYTFSATYIVVLVLVLVLDRTRIFEDDHLNPAIDYPHADVLLFARQCEAVIEKYGLSSREAEVLSLLVRGRSVPHISERLYVSRSTVKTHIEHIYQKLGVNDRQEMIDLIESTEPKPDDGSGQKIGE